MVIFKSKYSQRTVSNFSLHFDALAQFWLNYRLCDNIFLFVFDFEKPIASLWQVFVIVVVFV